MTREISHKGLVVSSEPDFTVVEIVRADACSECHAKDLCSVSRQEKKRVTVVTDPYNIHDVGEEVELCMKPSMGMKAVWISYILPLFVLMVAMFVLQAFGLGELYSALGAIGAVACYYLALLCFRKKLENEFEFYIK